MRGQEIAYTKGNQKRGTRKQPEDEVPDAEDMAKARVGPARNPPERESLP